MHQHLIVFSVIHFSSFLLSAPKQQRLPSFCAPFFLNQSLKRLPASLWFIITMEIWILAAKYNVNINLKWHCCFYTLLISPVREHAEDSQQSRQLAIPNANDHTWPGEWNQTVAFGEEPRPLRSKGGWPRKQDGLRDLPDQTARHKSRSKVSLSCHFSLKKHFYLKIMICFYYQRVYLRKKKLKREVNG